MLCLVFADIASSAFTLDGRFTQRSIDYDMISKNGRTVTSLKSSSVEIEYQSDESKYGRGDMHISAALDEGDIVVYQAGTWFVDGVPVGDGGPPSFHYALIENIQLVWTHNCEHGVIRALPLTLKDKTILKLVNEELIEFGPEQLIAKIPVDWNESEDIGKSKVELSDDLWKAATECIVE